MFALDVPSTVTQPDVPTLVAALPKDAKSMSGKFDQVLGLCFVKPNGPRVDGKYYSEGFDTNVNPAGSAFNYLFGIEHLHVNNDESVTLLQAPKHGTLSGVERQDGRGRYLYTPNDQFNGVDKIVFQVEIGGQRIKVIEYVHVVYNKLGEGWGSGEQEPVNNFQCLKDQWRIALSIDNTDPDALALSLPAVSWSGYDLSRINVHHQ